MNLSYRINRYGDIVQINSEKGSLTATPSENTYLISGNWNGNSIYLNYDIETKEIKFWHEDKEVKVKSEIAFKKIPILETIISEIKFNYEKVDRESSEIKNIPAKTIDWSSKIYKDSLESLVGTVQDFVQNYKSITSISFKSLNENSAYTSPSVVMKDGSSIRIAKPKNEKEAYLVTHFLWALKEYIGCKADIFTPWYASKHNGSGHRNQALELNEEFVKTIKAFKMLSQKKC